MISMPSQMVSFLAACLCRGRVPGCAPGGAVTFSCVAKRKSPKRRRPRCPCPLRCATGQPAVRASGGVRANSPAAQTARGPDPPEAVLLGTARGDGSQTTLRAIAALGPGLRTARGAGIGVGPRCSAAKLVLRPQSRNHGRGLMDRCTLSQPCGAKSPPQMKILRENGF